MASVFANVENVQESEIMETAQIRQAFGVDPHPHKVNLGPGAYRTDEGKPWVLPVVQSVEAMISNDITLNHEYLKVAGLPDYGEAAIKLLLGEDSKAIVSNKVEGVQAIGGTGAIRLAADFLKKLLGYNTVYVSNPTWGNHKGIFKACGFDNIKEYRYWDAAARAIDLKGMKEDFEAAPEKSVVILHACAHNPTGMDPTPEQWDEILEVIVRRKMFILVDIAYQGFCSGDVDRDAYLVRRLDKEGHEFFAAQSFSKNFGLYNERVGNLVIVAKDAESKKRAFSQLELIVRTTWSNPPNHGARIVASVLNNKSYYDDWKDNVKTMAERICLMRNKLYQKLTALGTPGKWNHVIEQKGMFSFTGLNPTQVDNLIKNHHIYLLKNGRINMCALTTGNLDYVANAIHEVVIAEQQQAKM